VSQDQSLAESLQNNTIYHLLLYLLISPLLIFLKANNNVNQICTCICFYIILGRSDSLSQTSALILSIFIKSIGKVNRNALLSCLWKIVTLSNELYGLYLV
jgi:hypothetical protein